MDADKKYCMSSFLMFRTIVNGEKCFEDGMCPKLLGGVDLFRGRIFMIVCS